MLLDGESVTDQQGSGVIMTFGGDVWRANPRLPHRRLRSCPRRDRGAARLLAAEVGQHGIRAVTLHSSGVPGSIPEDVAGGDAIVESIEATTMLKRAATFEDVGNVAAFVASDKALTVTATTVNITCGAVAD